MASDVRLDGENVELIGNVLAKRTAGGDAQILLDTGRDPVPEDLLRSVPTYIGLYASVMLGADGLEGRLGLDASDDERRVYIEGGRAVDEAEPEPDPDDDDSTLRGFDEAVVRPVDRDREGPGLLVDPSVFERPYRVYVNGIDATLVLGGDGEGGDLLATDGEGETTVDVDGATGTVTADALVLRSPSGTPYRVTVADDGSLSTEEV